MRPRGESPSSFRAQLLNETPHVVCFLLRELNHTHLPCVRLPLAAAAAAAAAEPWMKRARPELSSDSAQKPGSEKMPSLLRESSELPRTSVWITSARPADRAAWCSAAAAAPATSCSATSSTPACRTKSSPGTPDLTGSQEGHAFLKIGRLWLENLNLLVCSS